MAKQESKDKSSSANIKPPRRDRMGGPPPPRKGKTKKNTTRNSSNELVAMNFYVPAEFKREYKIVAAENDQKLIDILKESFELWKERHS